MGWLGLLRKGVYVPLPFAPREVTALILGTVFVPFGSGVPLILDTV